MVAFLLILTHVVGRSRGFLPVIETKGGIIMKHWIMILVIMCFGLASICEAACELPFGLKQNMARNEVEQIIIGIKGQPKMKESTGTAWDHEIVPLSIQSKGYSERALFAVNFVENRLYEVIESKVFSGVDSTIEKAMNNAKLHFEKLKQSAKGQTGWKVREEIPRMLIMSCGNVERLIGVDIKEGKIDGQTIVMYNVVDVYGPKN
jgi:hypothetical protein